ncbi:6790_t:CDS:10 [Entrophospora sp. SA101]|nr:6790_t:CDS:10 [Entrophospora sp. SA101]
MPLELENVKSLLPPGITLLPGETIEFIDRTSAIKLSKETSDGGFVECGYDTDEFYGQRDIANESIVLITNYRTCYHPIRNYSDHLATTSLTTRLTSIISLTTQIPHLSVSSLEESQSQITISLKFFPSKYLFTFSKSKRSNFSFENNGNITTIQSNNNCNNNSLCMKFAFILKDFVNPDVLENVFAFHMGESYISQSNDDDDSNSTGKKNIIHKNSKKKSIIHKGINEETFQCYKKLGWTSGYQIEKEFKRLKMDNESCRFPVVCWKKGHHVLMRSAQPMVGFFSSRGLEDEILIQEVLGAVSEEEQEMAKAKQKYLGFEIGSISDGKLTRNSINFDEKCQMKMCILDARNFTSAFSNIYKGGGYENIGFYPQNTTLEWLNLPNIHVISNAHSKLLREIATNASSPNWFSVLESTGWLNCVAGLLKAAGGKNGVVSKIVDDDSSVLVHCTDGWDRTPQLVSLAQIMLDPYYRTLKGFRVLIEKEWMAFGHQFRARGELPTKLSCKQFPTLFEFNDFLLLCLARASAGNSPYGDFLCNSEFEREIIRSNNNSCFKFDHAWKKEVLRPETGARVITLWSDYYFPKDDNSIALLSVPPGSEIMFTPGIKMPEKLLLTMCKKLVLNNKKIENKEEYDGEDEDDNKIYVEDMLLNSVLQDGVRSVHNDATDISKSLLLGEKNNVERYESTWVNLTCPHENDKIELAQTLKNLLHEAQTEDSFTHYLLTSSPPSTSDGISRTSLDFNDFVII